MSKISVACIVLNDKKEIFIAKRNPVGDMGDRWEFPGGKIEYGESDKVSIIREMQEEFGVDVIVHEKITEGSFFHKEKKVSLHAYRVEFLSDGIQTPFKLTEHSDYKWVDIEEIKNLNFVDSDLSIYEDVKKYIQNL